MNSTSGTLAGAISGSPQLVGATATPSRANVDFAALEAGRRYPSFPTIASGRVELAGHTLLVSGGSVTHAVTSGGTAAVHPVSGHVYAPNPVSGGVAVSHSAAVPAPERSLTMLQALSEAGPGQKAVRASKPGQVGVMPADMVATDWHVVSA